MVNQWKRPVIPTSKDPQVYLAVCGKSHAFALAKEYARMGRLAGLYAADQHYAPPAGVSSAVYFNRWDLKLWRVAERYSPVTLGHSLSREYAVFDSWLCRQFEKLPGGVFHGWNTHVSRALKHLDASRWLRCVERSCPHNLFQHEILLEESRRLDLPYTSDPDALAAAVQELYDADIIVAPSKYSADSYDDPVLRSKVRVNTLGGNYPYRERTRSANQPLRLLLVGNAFLRKGTHYLVEAFKLIDDPAAELWIRGEVPAEYRARITDSRIKIFPAVTYERLQQLYSDATLFCLPSVDEGFGMVGLEALSHGLPLIYTDHCGVADVLDAAVGRRVPIRSPAAIASAVQEIRGWHSDDYLHFDQERARVLAQNSWRQCAERMFAQVYLRPQAAMPESFSFPLDSPHHDNN